MYFLGSTMMIIRNAFQRKQQRAEDNKEKYKLAKREFNTIAKLSVIMGNFDKTIHSLNDAYILFNRSLLDWGVYQHRHWY